MPVTRHVLPALASLLVLGAMLAASSRALAQDLYDTSVLRTFNLTFHDANWLSLLRSNYISETLILADLEIDGVTYPSVGVRIRGNTSYTALPANSEKFSLKIDVDFVHANQDVLGYDNLNLNNGFRDPTFTREVVFNNYVAQFIPNPRANHVLLTLNGQNWGVYINVQQPDKRMLRDYYTNADGLRIRCANNPNGPGLAYNGPNASGYTAYEIQNDGGLVDPLGSLINVAFKLSNEPLASWPNIDAVFAVDPSIWSVALENFLTDDDSYINKGCDFMTYTDPLDGRMHLLQRDANETFTQTSWAITRNFSAVNKPVLSRVLAVPELRQRYMAHYRTIKRDLNWDYFGPIFAAHRNRIDAAVQADPKKLYSYTLFQNNYTSTVTMPLGGLAGGSIIGLQQFVTQRNTFLNGSNELVANGPAIASAQASNPNPLPTDPVWISAAVSPNGNPISRVDLYFRPNRDGIYQRVQMFDDGNSGDGAAGDGVYGALLQASGNPGQRIPWYVSATASNAFASMAFLPEGSELDPNYVEYALGGSPLRITEFMYSGVSGEFIEITNLSDQTVGLAGWSLDDDHAIPGTFSLGSAGALAPGEALIITESTASDFRTAWGLPEQTKVIGQLGAVTGNNLGRNDQIHLFDPTDALADRLDYGDQTFPGTIRTQNRSGQVPCSAIGQNQISAWVLASVGDAYGSVAASSGDIGSPGSFVAVDCSDTLFADGFEASARTN